MPSTITTSVVSGGSNSHATSSTEINALATDFISPGVNGTITLNTGSAGTGSFCVNAQASPAMFVDVKAGTAWLTATPSGQVSQKLRAYMASDYTSYAISSNSSGSTKYDWIYLQVSATAANNPAVDASDVTALYTSRSSSLTTDNGSPPTYGILLAVVTVANGASSIANAVISDRRTNSSLTTAATTTYFYDFVESGCVWSGDSYGASLAGSMSAGVVWIGGKRLTVAAVAARAFTASRDTYVDLSDNGDGTAVPAYAPSTTNAASQTLATGSMRIAIVVTAAGSIAAATSINQGQVGRLVPISGGFPYAVTDSLGNRICPRNGNPGSLGYSLDSTGATLTTGYVTHTKVIAKSRGGNIKLIWGAQVANGNSGADRNFTMQILCDGVATGIAPASLNFDTPYIAGVTTNLSYGFEHSQSDLAAGSHTWVVQYLASAGAAVVLTANFLEVIEAP